MGMTLTEKQRSALVDLARSGQIKEAIDGCEAAVFDNLAADLFERGGFATLQLNPPGTVPRMRFVSPDETRSVSSVKIAGAILAKNEG